LKNKYQKLNYDIVVEARKQAWAGKNIKEISKQLNVEYFALIKAIKGETWDHIKNPEPFIKEKIHFFVCRKCSNTFPKQEKINGNICNGCFKTYRKQFNK